MAAQNQLIIENLDLTAHREITSSLGAFWLSVANEALPYHHPMVPLLFSQFSFVLRKNRQIMAYLYGAHNEKRAFLHTIATRYAFYRKGYAGMLLTHWEEVALGKGLRSAWAYILPENTLSRQFLEKHQYISRKKIDVYSDVERVLFRKSLS